MRSFLVFFIFSLLLILPIQLNANPQILVFGKLFFGKEETIVTIQELTGTEYDICYKYTSHYYLAGLYLSDDGYVLQEKSNKFSYLPLDKETIINFQRGQLLPEPMPNYSIPISAYIFGYSLWWSLLIFVGILFFIFRSSSKKSKSSEQF